MNRAGGLTTHADQLDANQWQNKYVLSYQAGSCLALRNKVTLSTHVNSQKGRLTKSIKIYAIG